MKNYLKTLLLFTLSILLVNCTSDTPQNYNSSNSSLTEKLETYNETNVSNPMDCDGWLDCLGYVAMVSGADIIGAGTGMVAVSQGAATVGLATGGVGGAVVLVGAGVVCGAGASYGATQVCGLTVPAENIFPQIPSVDLPEGFEPVFEDIGIEHNRVLDDYYFGDGNIENYYLENRGFTTKQLEVLNSEMMVSANETIQQYAREYAKDFDYSLFLEKLVNRGYYTNDMKDVMSLFLSRYMDVNSFEEIEKLSTFYMNEVNRSKELTELEKKALIGSFLVAAESPRFFYED